MFDVATYLSKLGYIGSTEPTFSTLREIHKRHLLALPFDNSRNADAQRGFEILADVAIDADEVFDQIVVGGRGGVCYELNGLLRRLLLELGYDVGILAAAVIQVSGEFGPDLDHIFNRVHLDGQTYLVDVGLAGPSFLEPLRLTDEVQTQYGVDYRLVEEGDYWMFQRRSRGADWNSVYKFKLQDRQLSEWVEMVPSLVDFPVELVLLSTRIHSRATENGQLVLIGKRLVRVEDGEEEIRVLAKPAAYREAVEQILRPAG